MIVNTKPVLLGMNSPQSEDPDKALWPWNWASTGGRILHMLQEAALAQGGLHFAPEWYVGGFDRVNVLNRKRWDARLARASAPSIREQLAGRRVVICGLEVLRVMDLPRHEWLVWRDAGDLLSEQYFTYCVIPHPSGLTRFYNDPEKRLAVGRTLLGLYGTWVSSLTPDLRGVL